MQRARCASCGVRGFGAGADASPRSSVLSPRSSGCRAELGGPSPWPPDVGDVRTAPEGWAQPFAPESHPPDPGPPSAAGQSLPGRPSVKDPALRVTPCGRSPRILSTAPPASDGTRQHQLPHRASYPNSETPLALQDASSAACPPLRHPEPLPSPPPPATIAGMHPSTAQ